MDREKLKIGILGCGRVCEHYIDKIFIPGRVGDLYEIVACCDVDNVKSNNVGKKLSCQPYNNIDEFVKHKNMEIVVILTKSGQHFNHKQTCLENIFLLHNGVLENLKSEMLKVNQEYYHHRLLRLL